MPRRSTQRRHAEPVRRSSALQPPAYAGRVVRKKRHGPSSGRLPLAYQRTTAAGVNSACGGAVGAEMHQSGRAGRALQQVQACPSPQRGVLRRMLAGLNRPSTAGLRPRCACVGCTPRCSPLCGASPPHKEAWRVRPATGAADARSTVLRPTRQARPPRRVRRGGTRPPPATPPAGSSVAFGGTRQGQAAEYGGSGVPLALTGPAAERRSTATGGGCSRQSPRTPTPEHRTRALVSSFPPPHPRQYPASSPRVTP